MQQAIRRAAILILQLKLGYYVLEYQQNFGFEDFDMSE